MTVFLFQRHSIGTTSIQYAHWFLKEISEEANQVITAVSEEQCMLSDRVKKEIVYFNVMFMKISIFPEYIHLL